MMDKEIKREIMLDHYNHPNNKETVDDERYKSVHNASESCIDDITVFMLGEDGEVKDVKFDGVGCTICTASTDIMCDLIIGKSYDEARKIINEYYKMVDEKPFDEDTLEEANAFDTLYQQANRIKCGTIGIHAIEDLINEFDK
ncbi:MAG: SUF system NifU family Fe-S cluster assembly protein [Erysipelotrichaceae bacterium]|nr:SUF system NifU family Fe-S cluster assembly protein [Erysipelotrichaceae bacterium]